MAMKCPVRGHWSHTTILVLGVGDAVLYVEGAEAMQPFDRPIPLDAITVALLDTYKFTPPTES